MNVLLLGDSVRMFYQDEVKAQLGKDYEVFAPTENCRFSLFMLNSLRFWLSEFSTPDIIHFNAGLWDTAILYHEDRCFVSCEDYVQNMKRVLRELKKTGAKIIFATTTPVSDKKSSLPGPMPPAHKNSDIESFNKAVLKEFEGEDILINDLYSAMYPYKEKLLKDDMIHPNEEGIKLLSSAVSDKIKQCGAFHNEKCTASPSNINTEEKTIQ